MADPYVTQTRGVFTGTVGSTALSAGTAIYYDGTDWEKADATDESKFAEAIAIGNYAIGDTGAFCRRCIIRDIDSSTYTQEDQYFLLTTAGTMSATRPTGAANLVQVLGFALSDTELYIDIPPVREHHVWLTATATTAGEAGGTQFASTSNYGALSMNADDEDIFFTLEIPPNCIGLEIAHLWTGPDAIGATPTFDILVGAGSNDEAHANTTPDTSLTGTSVGGTANDIYKIDITSAFDASDIWQAGNLLGIMMTEKSGTSDVVMGFGINMVLKVV